jgi:hypothetical protein
MNIERPTARPGEIPGIHGVLRQSCLAALFASVVFLTACGSSSSSGGGSSPTSSSVNGTVATGSPAANIAVTAYEPGGASCGSATTAADGTYTLNGTCTPPYLVAAQTAQGLLVTPLLSGQTSGSITPITTAIFRVAAGNTTTGASAVNLAASMSSLTSTELATTQTSVLGALAALFPSYGWSGFNPYASFAANHTGIDGVFDQLGMQQGPAGSITFTNTAANQTVTITANGNGAPTVGPVTSTASSGSGSTGSGSTGSGSTGSGSTGSGSGSTGSGSTGSGSTGSGSTGSGSTGSGSGSGSGSGTAPVLHCAP